MMAMKITHMGLAVDFNKPIHSSLAPIPKRYLLQETKSNESIELNIQFFSEIDGWKLQGRLKDVT